MSAVIFFCFCLWSLFDVFGTEFVSVTEGDSVTLSVNLTEIQMEEEISWKFGPKDITIAETERKGTYTRLHEERADGRFKGRLKLDHTGSLTINNIRTDLSGLYKIITTSLETQLHVFNLTVYARLPVPVITRDSSSSVSNCSVLCSVMNVAHVSLSWYKGKSLLSSISVSEHRDISSISLHLECLDDSYTCVINNPITNQTQHLTADVCHKCSAADISEDHICKCTLPEAVIRLVVSALVVVAAFIVVVYDVRSRRDEQKKKRSDQKIRPDIELNTLDSAGS